jgi:hypothetical protein
VGNRPPFDDVTAADNAVAASLGARSVLSTADPASHIVDSQDWKGLSSQQMVYNITHGYKDEQGNWILGIQSGSIIGFHEGMSGSAPAQLGLCRAS